MSLVLGIDMGTSGARVVALGEGVEAEAKAALKGDLRTPQNWLAAVETALFEVLSQIDPSRVAALSLDGTSGTLLAVDENGQPQAQGVMYNDPCEDLSLIEKIAKIAPDTSAAHGASSGLARAITLQGYGSRLLHQADWLSFQFSGRFVSDENNALKTGYDPVEGKWPDWMEATGIEPQKLPSILPAGGVIGEITPQAAKRYGLPKTTLIIAGTTDGCAAFLATGAQNAGDGVTSLGTTLTVKLVSEKPIFSPQSGIYSHKVLGNWLAGGASNTGGVVLLQHFTPDEIAQLSLEIDPDFSSPYDYYPLPKAGERFPYADPNKAPVMEPVPENRAEFLKAIFEGIARIEETAYARLGELGGASLSTMRTVGGGASNEVWSALRKRRLNVPFHATISNEAAYGSALLARHGLKYTGIE